MALKRLRRIRSARAFSHFHDNLDEPLDGAWGHREWQVLVNPWPEQIRLQMD